MIITSDDWDHSRKFPAFSTSKKLATRPKKNAVFFRRMTKKLFFCNCRRTIDTPTAKDPYCQNKHRLWVAFPFPRILSSVGHGYTGPWQILNMSAVISHQTWWVVFACTWWPVLEGHIPHVCW